MASDRRILTSERADRRAEDTERWVPGRSRREMKMGSMRGRGALGEGLVWSRSLGNPDICP